MCILTCFYFRRKVVETERTRAAGIAALPTPVDPVQVSYSFIKFTKCFLALKAQNCPL